MSQVGKYLNLKPHMQSWAVYNENGPYTSAYKIGSLAPAQFGGLSYKILNEKGGDVYIIQTESFGRCAIWAPRDNDSSITSTPAYANGGSSSGGSTGGTGKYLNLHPHMQSWAVYNENGPYTSTYKIGSLAPAQFGGLSYKILDEKGGDVYIIQTESFGRCAIWAPRDNDSSITSTPAYTNGGSSSGGSSGENSGNGGVEIPGALKVFIDPGHGGTDPGAVGNGLQEKNIVLSIAKKLGVILNSYGISVKYSRETDTFVDLAPRAQMANNWGANLFVSIHANSATASASGTECFTHPYDVLKTKTLSSNIATSISNALGIQNRGHKEEDFAVLRLTSMPAILVETAFITNSDDANLLITKQDDFANAIAIEILKFLNISTEPTTEILVVSGQEGGENEGRFKYNFIETAIKKLIEIKNSSESREIITWLIDSGSYSQTDIDNFKSTASKIGVNIQFINSKTEFFNYINTSKISGNGKRIYPISKFTLFGHGEVGRLLLGSNYNIEISDLNKLNSSAFKKTHSIFYSCNTATDGNNSFAYNWNSKINGVTEAVVYRTDYAFITYSSSTPSLDERSKVKLLRASTGYIQTGSYRYPIPAKEDNAYWVTF